MSKIALSVVLLALVAGCGSTATPDAAPSSSTVATTTTTSAAPTTSTSARPHGEDMFVRVLRDKGYVKTTMDETLLLAEGDLHCRSLADGLTRQKILDAAGLPGSTARTKSEAVFFTAVTTICPEHAGKATS